MWGRGCVAFRHNGQLGTDLEGLKGRVLSSDLLQCVKHVGRQISCGPLYSRSIKVEWRVTDQ